MAKCHPVKMCALDTRPSGRPAARRAARAIAMAVVLIGFASAGDALAKGKKKRAGGAAAVVPAQTVTPPSGGGKGRTAPLRVRPHHSRETSVARAEPTEAAYCSSAYTKALDEQKSGHLREAKEFLGVCAKTECGDFMKQECLRLYTLTDSDIPSVVPIVTDKTGHPVSLVEVRMDGDLLTSKLDGEALAVNPGTHEFSFSTNQGTFATRKVFIMQGQHNRRIAVRQ